jgi:ribosomal protein S27E
MNWTQRDRLDAALAVLKGRENEAGLVTMAHRIEYAVRDADELLAELDRTAKPEPEKPRKTDVVVACDGCGNKNVIRAWEANRHCFSCGRLLSRPKETTTDTEPARHCSEIDETAEGVQVGKKPEQIDLDDVIAKAKVEERERIIKLLTTIGNDLAAGSWSKMRERGVNPLPTDVVRAALEGR